MPFFNHTLGLDHVKSDSQHDTLTKHSVKHKVASYYYSIATSTFRDVAICILADPEYTGVVHDCIVCRGTINTPGDVTTSQTRAHTYLTCIVYLQL